MKNLSVFSGRIIYFCLFRKLPDFSIHRYGLLYLLIFTLQAMLLPEPTYKGPESITYFRANALDEELSRDTRITWIITFYAAWSPSCVNFSPVFSKLSASYSLPNLKFGKYKKYAFM